MALATAQAFTWSTEVEPGALAEQFSPIYREGLETLKQQLESAG